MAKTFKKWWAENEADYDRYRGDRHFMIAMFQDCWDEAAVDLGLFDELVEACRIAAEPWTGPSIYMPKLEAAIAKAEAQQAQRQGLEPLMLKYVHQNPGLTNAEYEEMNHQMGELAKED